jgi:hypothetical protein
LQNNHGVESLSNDLVLSLFWSLGQTTMTTGPLHLEKQNTYGSHRFDLCNNTVLVGGQVLNASTEHYGNQLAPLYTDTRGL